jgi:hypothetical protein
MCVEIMRAVRERCRFLGPRNPTNPHIKVSSVVDTGLHPKVIFAFFLQLESILACWSALLCSQLSQ